MKVVTAAEMREIDRITIEEIGISSLVLMERAGLSVAHHIARSGAMGRITVLAGGGNNGGDGLVVARELFNRGFAVKAVLLSDPATLSKDCQVQYDIARNMGVDIQNKKTITEEDIGNDCIVDALLGTGLDRPVQDSLAEAIDVVNGKPRQVWSVDIPSGISSDTGAVMGTAIRASYTVTFGLPKRGHLLYPGKEYTGSLFIEDIGFPGHLTGSEHIRCELLEKELMAVLVPARHPSSYKGTYGRVLVVGGAQGKTGAALMSARAVLRTGAGLVTLAVPESLAPVFQARVTEEMTLPLADDGKAGFSEDAASQILDHLAKNSTIIAIGPGMGVNRTTRDIMARLIQNTPVPLIIDADGLSSLYLIPYEERIALLNSASAPLVLTPHVGEMARLIHDGTENFADCCQAIEEDRIGVASNLAITSTAYVVLKGVPTVICDPEGAAFLNPTGSSSMATAGAGDVLTGMVASLAAQGLPPLFASLLGVYLHGLAGEICAEKKGPHSTVATDLIENISDAFHYLLSKDDEE